MENRLTAKGLVVTLIVMGLALASSSIGEIRFSLELSLFAYFHPTHSTITETPICSMSENGCLWFEPSGGGGWGRFGMVRV